MKRLTAIAVAAAFGVIDPAASLLDIPAVAIANVLDDDADDDRAEESEPQAPIVELLARDPRPVVRARVALAAPIVLHRAPEVAHAILRLLASDGSARVRRSAAQGLVSLLERASPIERVEMVCQWTVSGLSTERAAIARALHASTPVLVADLAIEQLARDGDAQVRLAAARAATRHFGESAELYTRVARTLAADPNRLVRRAALRLLERDA